MQDLKPQLVILDSLREAKSDAEADYRVAKQTISGLKEELSSEKKRRHVCTSRELTRGRNTHLGFPGLQHWLQSWTRTQCSSIPANLCFDLLLAATWSWVGRLRSASVPYFYLPDCGAHISLQLTLGW